MVLSRLFLNGCQATESSCPGDVITEYDGIALVDMQAVDTFVTALAVSHPSCVTDVRNEEQLVIRFD